MVFLTDLQGDKWLQEVHLVQLCLNNFYSSYSVCFFPTKTLSLTLSFSLSNDSQAEQWEGDDAGVSVLCSDLTAGFCIGPWAMFVCLLLFAGAYLGTQLLSFSPMPHRIVKAESRL